MSPLLAALALAAAAFSQEAAEVRRSNIRIEVKIAGNLAFQDVIRIKSTIEGRLDEVHATHAWMKPDEPLGVLANRDMAAIYDSHLSSSRSTVEERWRQLYRPSPVACPSECFVIRAFFGSREWVNAGSVLFEAARRVRLVGRIEPEDAALVRDGMPFEFWPVSDPAMKFKGRMEHYTLDPRAGGTFWMDMAPSRFLGATQAERWKGEKWEGAIVPLERKNVLVAPTKAVVRFKDVLYLPVRVSTGLTTKELTEITAGVEEKRPILVLGGTSLKQAAPHKPEDGIEAIQRRLREEPQAARDEQETGEPAPPPGTTAPGAAQGKTRTAKPRPARPEGKPAADYGDDPYP